MAPRRRSLIGRSPGWPGAAAAALVLGALSCTSPGPGASTASGEPDGPEPGPSGVVELAGEAPSQWDVSHLTLSEEHAGELLARLEANAAHVPEDLPASLLEADKRPALLHERSEPTAEGEIAGLLTVANPWAVPFRGRLVCVRDWRQAPCSPLEDTIAVDLPGWSAVQHPFAFGAGGGATIFALLLLEGDRRAVESTSLVHLVNEPEGWDEDDWPARPADAYEIDPPFPGCGVAAFHDGRSIDSDYALPDVIGRQAGVSVLVDACEEFGPTWIVPLLVRNRSELVDLDWVGRPLLLDRSVELPVATSVTRDPSTESLQFAWIIREGGTFLSALTPEVLLD